MDEQSEKGIDSPLFRRTLAIMVPLMVNLLMVGLMLERRLGRPLTAWDWQVYHEEMENRRQWVTWWAAQINDLIQFCNQIAWRAEMCRQVDRRIADRETIRRFVWGGFFGPTDLGPPPQVDGSCHRQYPAGAILPPTQKIPHKDEWGRTATDLRG